MFKPILSIYHTSQFMHCPRDECYGIFVLFETRVGFLCHWVLEDIYSISDFKTFPYFIYQNLCLNTFLYEGVMLKLDIANKIHSMLMVFPIHARLGRITCNDICLGFFYLTYSTIK